MSDVDFFLSQINRLKSALGLSKDKEVAEALGLTDKALNARKARRSFPEREVIELAESRPELQIDVKYVLTGKRSPAHVMAKLAKAGERVRKVREEAGLSVAEFASSLGVKADYVQRVEAADSWFANDLLSPIIEKYAVSPLWLLSGELPVLEGDLSAFEVFVLERYKLCSPTQRTAMRAHAADLLQAANAPAPPAPEATPVKVSKPRVKKG